MTVSERSLDGLGAVLEGWLAGQAGVPGRPTVTGVRVPDTGGLSSRSVLFEASVTDHLARARFGGEEGWGLFEHASMGRHDPSGFADWAAVAR
jgi:hypothetical protein